MQRHKQLVARVRAASLLCVLLFYGAAASAEQVDNPGYTAWAKLQPGSSVTHSMIATTNGQVVNMTVTGTLLELTAEGAVIETSIVTEVAGQRTALPKQTTKVAKMEDRDKQDAGSVDAAKLANAREETIRVPAGTFKAKVVEINDNKDGSKLTGRVWFCEDVPSGMVKMEMHSEGARTGDVKAELLSVQAKTTK